jgi:DNA-binding NtrC family response regulator
MAGEKILLVDDEEEFIRILAERLEARGMKVAAACSGDEAIKIAGTSDFDAVVLDLSMPGKDGIETLKELRGINGDLQVILLTGHATVDKGVQSIKLGARDFLEKPLDFEKLLLKIAGAAAAKARIAQQKSKQNINDILKKKGW